MDLGKPWEITINMGKSTISMVISHGFWYVLASGNLLQFPIENIAIYL